MRSCLERRTISYLIMMTSLCFVWISDGNGGSVYSQCSCYTFDGRLKNWKYGRDDCRTQGGDLVSMETVEEWEFLKTQIQNRTSGIFDEWWIGLKKRDGEWTWLSNHSLTYDKWQPYNPRVQQYKKCVVMSRNYPVDKYGLFNNVECMFWKGWICEIKTKELATGCSNFQVQWCPSQVTPILPMMVLKRGLETTSPTITTTATTDPSTNTPYNSNLTRQTTPFKTYEESDPAPPDHAKPVKAVAVNTDCLFYPLLVTALFVIILGGLTVLTTVAFFLVPLVKNRRSVNV